jgi:hypothetical protein
MKQNEEFCRLSFDEHLKSLCTFPSLIWRDGSEPPDYYLDCGPETFAVEVTSMMEDIQVGEIPLRMPAITKTLTNFVKEVERNVIDNGLLNGAFTVTFIQPIENFKAVKDGIARGLVEYIAATQILPNYLSLDVFHEDRRQIVRIEKSHNKKNVLYPVGPVFVKWGGEIKTDIVTILNERLATKTQKLRDIRVPKILLLNDGYSFADPDDYFNCISKLENLKNYHTVFIVSGIGGNFILYSEDQRFILEKAI